MIHYPDKKTILKLHTRIIERSGGSFGVRDEGLVESAIGQPRMTFSGNDLYPTLGEKAAAIGFSLIKNHPFVDGNKRIGHGAIELLLGMNGFEISAPVEEQEDVVLRVASSEMSREEFTDWLTQKVVASSR